MEKIKLKKFIKNKIVLGELNNIPYPVECFINESLKSEYSKYIHADNYGIIGFRNRNLIKNEITLHEILHLKAVSLGYARVILEEEPSEWIKESIFRLQSTYEHICFVYPSMKKLGFYESNDNHTKDIIEKISMKPVSSITSWDITILVCALFETDDKIILQKISKIIEKIPKPLSRIMSKLSNCIIEGEKSKSIQERNNILCKMIEIYRDDFCREFFCIEFFSHIESYFPICSE